MEGRIAACLAPADESRAPLGTRQSTLALRKPDQGTRGGVWVMMVHWVHSSTLPRQWYPSHNNNA